MALGTVKWFNPTKGYGFIAPDDGGKVVFVHISAVEKAGHTSLVEGAKVSYEVMTNRSGKQAAENLRLG
ncbi:cold-shock protein [Bradyrhizobium sacchari]|uniref:Putative cold-shock DNA-binding protein n=1 Tax=Bradyrhizobium sacchari TaxID=1399419 RepID=A0A560IZZ9_9BRAD|nr:cold-shock protein [Bradyrhizobium sacchari]TWB64476.1 putative cold-shock DNA-binding protein [Bradyrhizobium sacchari]TWB80799.1 putative cold-shock DNA-binding protein [Bradyrhizobium sacchari]